MTKIGQLELHNADCMEIMPRFASKHFDLAIADPPYGIFGNNGNKSAAFNWKKEADGGTLGSKYKGQAKKWDTAPMTEYFTELKRISKHQIIWGANYFGFPFQNFAIWRKLTISEKFSMSMAEIASVSCEGNGKVFEYQPQDTNRFHPTQKPVALYSWLLENYGNGGGQNHRYTHGQRKFRNCSLPKRISNGCLRNRRILFSIGNREN